MTAIGERLARIETKVDNTSDDIKEIKQWEGNHMEHHRKYTYFSLTTCIGLIVTLVILIIKLV